MLIHRSFDDLSLDTLLEVTCHDLPRDLEQLMYRATFLVCITNIIRRTQTPFIFNRLSGTLEAMVGRLQINRVNRQLLSPLAPSHLTDTFVQFQVSRRFLRLNLATASGVLQVLTRGSLDHWQPLSLSHMDLVVPFL